LEKKLKQNLGEISKKIWGKNSNEKIWNTKLKNKFGRKKFWEQKFKRKQKLNIKFRIQLKFGMKI